MIRLLLFSAIAATVSAQEHPQWGTLEPGPYGVGVRVIQTWDHSRTYWPKRDWRGDVHPGPVARPIQIIVWYPTSLHERGPRMRFGGYLDLWAGELGGRSEAVRRERMTEYRQGPFSPLYPNGMPDSVWARITAVPTAARMNARPARGAFPFLIHSGIGGASAQSVMHEYLASHGYVVASTPFLNSSPAWYGRGEWTTTALDDEVRDIGVVYATLRTEPVVDREKIAVIGMGAHAGLYFQMRTGLLSAVALLDVTLPAAGRRLPYYDPARVRIPLFDLANTEYPRDPTLLDPFRYAEQFRARARELPHVDFYQFRRVGSPETAKRQPNYELISRSARAFLDAVLKGDSAARNGLLAGTVGIGPASLIVTRRPAMPPAPTEAEFLTLVRNQGIEPGVRVYREVKARDPDARLFGIDGLRTVAMFLIRDRGPAQATTALRLIGEAYPDSARVDRFLGDWYARGQVTEEARRFYRSALGKLATDGSMSAGDKERMEREIHEALDRLPPA